MRYYNQGVGKGSNKNFKKTSCTRGKSKFDMFTNQLNMY